MCFVFVFFQKHIPFHSPIMRLILCISTYMLSPNVKAELFFRMIFRRFAIEINIPAGT